MAKFKHALAIILLCTLYGACALGAHFLHVKDGFTYQFAVGFYYATAIAMTYIMLKLKL